MLIQEIHSLRFDCCVFLFYSSSAVTFATKSAHNGLLIAAARLDSDPLDSMLPQPHRQPPLAIRRVVDLQPLRTPVECRIELAFASVDAGAGYAMLAHLPRPFLVMRTPRFLQPSGPDE